MRSIITIAAAALIGTAAQAVTVINGSFEDGVAIADNSFVTVNTGDTTSIAGWTVLAEGVDYIGTFWQASDGTRSLDLSALTAGGVRQRVFGFEVGKRYRLTFDLSANPGGGENPRSVLYSITGGTPQITPYFLTGDNSNSNMLYQTITYDFVASAAQQDLQFRSASLSAYGAVIDNVSISLVPEPATWGLMIAGFGMVGLAARRRGRARTLVA